MPNTIVKYPVSIFFSEEDFDGGSLANCKEFFEKRVFNKSTIFFLSTCQFNLEALGDDYSNAECDREFLYFNIIVNLKKENPIMNAEKVFCRIREYFNDFQKLNCRFWIYAVFEEPKNPEEQRFLCGRINELKKLMEKGAEIFLISKTPYLDGAPASPQKNMSDSEILHMICYSIFVINLCGKKIKRKSSSMFSSLGLRKVASISNLFKYAAATVLLKGETVENPSNKIFFKTDFNISDNEIKNAVEKEIGGLVKKIFEREALFGLMINKKKSDRKFEYIDEAIETYFGNRVERYYHLNITNYLTDRIGRLEQKFAENLRSQINDEFEGGRHEFYDLANNLAQLDEKIENLLFEKYGTIAIGIPHNKYQRIRLDELKEASAFEGIDDLLPYNCAEKYIDFRKEQDIINAVRNILICLYSVCDECLKLIKNVAETAKRITDGLGNNCYLTDNSSLKNAYLNYFRLYKNDNRQKLSREFYSKWLLFKKNTIMTEYEMKKYIEDTIAERQHVDFMVDKVIETDDEIYVESNLNVRVTPSHNHEKFLFGISPAGVFCNELDKDKTIDDDKADGLYILRYDLNLEIGHIVSISI